MSSSPIDPQALLEHGAFVRALVRSLVADEHRAADVEQQTWLAALRRPPRRVDRARAFLAIVAKNFARRAHRDDRRRDERARELAEDAGVVPSPDEILELEARRKRVIDAVLKLEPTYRSVVLLRYVSDLTPAEIALRLDVPLETVKTRLKRALAMLRARFDAEHAGDRAAWCATFAPLAGLTAPANAAAAGVVVGATWITGALIMKVLAWSAAAIASIAVVGMLWTWNDDSTDATRDATVVVAPSDEATSGGSDPREAAADVAPAVDPDAASTQRTSVGVAEARDAVFGIVRDSNGKPVAGALVELRRNADELGASLLETRPRRPPVFAEAVTGQDGRFSIDVRAGRLVDVFASHRDHAVAGAVGVTVGDEVELVLQHHASVFGRITRKADGSAVVRATVRLFNPAEPWRDLSTEPDADGLFSFRAVAPGRVTLAIGAVDLADPPWERLDLKPGEAVRRDVALDDGVVVRGRVTDAVTKAPIANAEISAGWTFRSSVRTDADGRYEYRGYGEWGVYDLHCRADGYGRTETGLAIDPARSEYVVDFALLPARRARGVIVDRTGRPVVSASITAFSSMWSGSSSENSGLEGMRQRIDTQSTRSGDDGAFLIDNLRPDVLHALHIEHADHGRTVYDFPANELQLAVVEFGEIVVASRQRVWGRVIDSTGSPVAFAVIALFGTNADRMRYSKREEPWFDGYVEERETRSAADGSFIFDRVAPGSYSLRHTRPSQQQSTKLAIRVEEGHDVEGIELRIPTTLTIRGRVVGASGSLPSWVTVLARRTDEPGGPESIGRVDPNGSFAIEVDTDGVYTVDARPSREPDDPMPPLLSTSVDGVRPGGLPIELVLGIGASIRGRVVDTEGKPASSAHVVLDGPAGQPLTWALSRGGGRFELVVTPGTVGSLRARTVAQQSARLADADPSNDGEGYSPSVPAQAGDVDVELVVPIDSRSRRRSRRTHQVSEATPRSRCDRFHSRRIHRCPTRLSEHAVVVRMQASPALRGRRTFRSARAHGFSS